MLQRVLGVSANIWNNLEANYRLFLARQKVRKELAKFTEWAQRFPIKQLIERGLIEHKENFVETIEQLLDFFGVGASRHGKQNTVSSKSRLDVHHPLRALVSQSLLG